MWEIAAIGLTTLAASLSVGSSADHSEQIVPTAKILHHLREEKHVEQSNGRLLVPNDRYSNMRWRSRVSKSTVSLCGSRVASFSRLGVGTSADAAR